MSTNKVQQSEELEALSAIYGPEWRKEVDSEASYCMTITREVQLFITLNPNYPSEKPPSYQLLAPTLSGEQKQQVYAAFGSIYQSNLGEPILFQWIEKLKEIVEEQDQAVNQEESKNSVEAENTSENNLEHCKNPLQFNIVHGSVIQDRKSIFQGHACSVESLQQVKSVMEELLQNKKVAQATHNILAYRISLDNGSILQDYDDDGETHAGGRLLHLLQILNVTNVMVIVTRWYGGTHLGPDRFRHINNSARQALQQAGFLNNKTT